jgi:hypothetical protein
MLVNRYGDETMYKMDFVAWGIVYLDLLAELSKLP